jgi:putative ABC transport system permease protein
MPTLEGLRYTLRSLLRRATSDQDTADEIAFHIERETRRLVDAGVPAAEASRRANARFGGTTRWREEAAAARPGHLVESVWRDAALAARSLLARPRFALPALVTLAIGIGANSAVFSVVRATVLDPLPFREPERLAAIWQTVGPAELEYLQQNARSFEQVAAFSPGWGYSLVGVGEPMQVNVARTSTNFFRTLGVAPAAGREFLDSESAQGQAFVVVLSHDLWIERFGGDPQAVGRVVSMNDQPHRIVGVAPARFEAFQPGVQAWIPLEIDRASPFYRSSVALAFGRLRTGMSFAAAESELAAFIPRLREILEAPRDYGRSFAVKPLKDAVVQESRQSLLVLFGAACFIMLIAGANYGNLLLLRVAGRQREVAVRTALGASRTRIVGHFVIESLVLSLAGGALGFVVGAAGVRALRLLLPTDVPRLASVSVDPGLVAACAALAVLIGVVCGVAPAVIATRRAQGDALREAGGVARTSGGGRLRGAMVVVEFASALVLLVGAGLMLQTAWRMQRVHPGFTADRVLTFRLQPTTTRVTAGAARVDYFDELLARIAALPGVEAVGTSQHLPLTGFNWGTHLAIEDRPAEPGATPPRVIWRTISGDYLGAMGIPLRRGRLFGAQDNLQAPRVVLINETMARRFWPDQDPLGKRIRLGRPPEPWTTIIGVVGDVRFNALSSPPAYEVYRPLAQVWQSSAHFAVRTSGEEPMLVMPAIRRIIRAYDATVPISAVRPMRAIVAQSLGQTNMVMWLLLAFAAVGITLGAVGIYGVVSYDVAQRTREIGIRAALGAGSGSIQALVLRRAGSLALAGIVVGGVAAALSARALESLVFGVEVRDPATYGALCGLLMLVALMAAFLPARRAVRVDPVLALRSE